jgi:hypothetical protein
MKTWEVSVLFLLIPVSAPCAEDHQKRAKPKPASTPEQAVEQFNRAVDAHDAEGIMAILTNQGRTHAKAGMAAAEENMKARKVFEEAMDKKFGKDPSDWAREFQPRSILFLPGKIQILSKEPKGQDKVELTVKFTGPPGRRVLYPETEISAVKEGGGWKLDVFRYWSRATDKQIRQMSLQMWKGFWQDLADQVKQGKFENRDEAIHAEVVQSQKMAKNSEKLGTVPQKEKR